MNDKEEESDDKKWTNRLVDKKETKKKIDKKG